MTTHAATRRRLPGALTLARAVMCVQAVTVFGVGVVVAAAAIRALAAPQRCSPVAVDCGALRGLLGIGVFAGLVLVATGLVLVALTWTAARSVTARAVAQTVEVAGVIVALYWRSQGADVTWFVLAAVPCVLAALMLGLSGVRESRSDVVAAPSPPLASGSRR